MSLVSHYTWNEQDSSNTRDYSTNGNDSTAMLVTGFIASEIGQAVRLDGVNDVITFGDINDPGETKTFSIAAKIRIGSTAENPIAYKKDQYTVGIDAGQKAFLKVVIGSTTYEVTSATSVTTGGDYKHVVWTFDGEVGGGGGKIYIDGVLDANTLSQAGNVDSSANPFKIGFDDTDYGTFRCETLSYYTQTLTQDEVTALKDQPGGIKIEVSNTDLANGDLVQLTSKVGAAKNGGVITGDLGSSQYLFLPISTLEIPISGEVLRHAGNVYDTTRQCTYLMEYQSGAPELVFRDGVVDFSPGDDTIQTKLACDEQIVSSLENRGPVFFENPITPAALTVSQQDDWSPTDVEKTNMIRVSSTNSTGTDLTGLQAPSPAKNQVIFFRNIGAKNVTLKNEDVGSVAANRFELKNDIIVQGMEGALICYDKDASRWAAIAINT